MRFRVIDIETTGAEPSEIIEIAAVDVVTDGARWFAEPPRARLFRPLGPISFHAMAVHHLTPDDFGDATPCCEPELLAEFVRAGERPDYFVAHNASFERQHIPGGATLGAPWLCTVKAARAVWEGAPGYSNQVLRYWRGLRLDPALAMPPHRAAPDAWVTAHLLIDMLAGRSAAELVALHDAPPAMNRMPFGRHKGKDWADVPKDYLAWMTGQTDMDPVAVERARLELARRAPA